MRVLNPAAIDRKVSLVRPDESDAPDDATTQQKDANPGAIIQAGGIGRAPLDVSVLVEREPPVIDPPAIKPTSGPVIPKPVPRNEARGYPRSKRTPYAETTDATPGEQVRQPPALVQVATPDARQLAPRAGKRAPIIERPDAVHPTPINVEERMLDNPNAADSANPAKLVVDPATRPASTAPLASDAKAAGAIPRWVFIAAGVVVAVVVVALLVMSGRKRG